MSTSYPILVILILSAEPDVVPGGLGTRFFGISEHRTWAFVTLGEGIINLLLSITLVHYFQRCRNHGPIADGIMAMHSAPLFLCSAR